MFNLVDPGDADGICGDWSYIKEKYTKIRRYLNEYAGDSADFLTYVAVPALLMIFTSLIMLTDIYGFDLP